MADWPLRVLACAAALHAIWLVVVATLGPFPARDFHGDVAPSSCRDPVIAQGPAAWRLCERTDHQAVLRGLDLRTRGWSDLAVLGLIYEVEFRAAAAAADGRVWLAIAGRDDHTRMLLVDSETLFEDRRLDADVHAMWSTDHGVEMLTTPDGCHPCRVSHRRWSSGAWSTIETWDSDVRGRIVATHPHPEKWVLWDNRDTRLWRVTPDEATDWQESPGLFRSYSNPSAGRIERRSHPVYQWNGALWAAHAVEGTNRYTAPAYTIEGGGLRANHAPRPTNTLLEAIERHPWIATTAARALVLTASSWFDSLATYGFMRHGAYLPDDDGAWLLDGDSSIRLDGDGGRVVSMWARLRAVADRRRGLANGAVIWLCLVGWVTRPAWLKT